MKSARAHIASIWLILHLAMMPVLMQAQGLVATNTVLDNGKDASQRPSSWLFNQNSTAVTLVTAPGSAIWEIPVGGNLYAAVDVPPDISVGQLLTGINIDVYNRACPQTAFFEAANHAYTIQSIASGGVTNVVAVAATSACEPTQQRLSVAVEYGRRRVDIAVGTADGKIVLGRPTPILFSLPPGYPVANFRVEFGANVLINGMVKNVFTFPADAPLGAFPFRVDVVYPSEYQSLTARIEAVATEGNFLSGDPLFASGPGLQATGSIVTGTNSFPVVKPPAGALTVTKRASANTIRSGGQVIYTYSVQNNNSTDVSNVSLWDSKLGEIQSIALLATGAQVTASSGPRELRSTTENYAMATGRDPFGNTVQGQSTPVTVTVIDPYVELNIWDSSPAKEGADHTLYYTIRNRGDVKLDQITVQDAADGWTQGAGADLEPGQEIVVTRTVRVTAATKNRVGRVTARVPADGGIVSGEDSHEIDLRKPDLKISITADKTSVNPGDEVVYTISIENSGDDDLYNITVSDDGFGSVATLSVMTSGQAQSYTFKETVQRTTTHTVTGVAQDRWNASLNRTDNVTVDVVYPLLSVKVMANGAPSTVSVSKGDKVMFTFNVVNAGNCPITVSRVLFEGQTLGGTDVELAVGSTMILPGVELAVEKTGLYRITVTGKDPSGRSHAWADEIEVKVSELSLASLQALIADAKSLINEIERLKTRFDAVQQEFEARLGMHANRRSNPCDDAGLQALLTEAASISARITSSVQALLAIIKNPVVAAASGVEVLDVISFATHASQTDPDIRQKVTAMQQKWASLGCGAAPEAKSDLVEVTVRVADPSGKAVSGAAVTCASASLPTRADGSCIFTVPLDNGDEVTASASATILPGYTVTSSGAATYTGGGAVVVMIVLNASAEQPVTVSGNIVDAGARPLGNVSVTALGATATTGSDGSYTITGTAELEKPITVSASVRLQDGSMATGGTSVIFRGQTSLSIPQIMISGAETEQDFSVSGTVQDGNGIGIPGVPVTAAPGGISGTTGTGGQYTLSGFRGVRGAQVTISAAVTGTDGMAHSGSATAVYEGRSPASAPAIVISTVQQEIEITISGEVVDANGKAIAGAAVTAGGLAKTTGGDGWFNGLGPLKVTAGSAVRVDATVKTADGSSIGGSGAITPQVAGDISMRIVIAGVTAIDESKAVKSLSVTSDHASINIGATAGCTAIATFDDNTTADVTFLATWTGAVHGRFTGTEYGSMNISASYKGISGDVWIEVGCPTGTEWNHELRKCISLDNAIDETKPADGNSCDPAAAASDAAELKQSAGQGDMFADEARTSYLFFMKRVADQNSRVCENTALAGAFAGTQRIFERYGQLSERIAALAASIVWRRSACPETAWDAATFPSSEAATALAAKHQGQYSVLGGWIQEMRAELQRYGCDEEEVKSLGNTIADNTKDPNVTGDDGTKEICGDGIDNDGDGLYDEGCEEQGNFNVTLILYDSGSAKDDVFGLSVSTQGTLGNTPAGGARTYPIQLPPGSYVATITVILAPDDVGTFTLVVREGTTAIASTSGSPGQGAVVTLPFTVSGTGGMSKAAPVEPESETVFFNEEELARQRSQQRAADPARHDVPDTEFDRPSHR